MHIALKDKISLTGSKVNEDRAGQAGKLAWVIDGATDVLENRILPGLSDSQWFASQLDQAFMHAAMNNEIELKDIVTQTTSHIAGQFEQTALRPISKPYEQPSAAGILIRLSNEELSFFSLGDCSLIALPGRTKTQDIILGDIDRSADEDVRKAASQIAANKDTTGEYIPIRDELLPMLRAARGRLNCENGYGIFSITPAPEKFVKSGTINVQTDDRFLLASDGFMRLVDVYKLYSLEKLGDAIMTKGIANLTNELREFEQKDLACIDYPRAKAKDDATAMILEIV